MARKSWRPRARSPARSSVSPRQSSARTPAWCYAGGSITRIRPDRRGLGRRVARRHVADCVGQRRAALARGGLDVPVHQGQVERDNQAGREERGVERVALPGVQRDAVISAARRGAWRPVHPAPVGSRRRRACRRGAISPAGSSGRNRQSPSTHGLHDARTSWSRREHGYARIPARRRAGCCTLISMSWIAGVHRKLAELIIARGLMSGVSGSADHRQ